MSCRRTMNVVRTVRQGPMRPIYRANGARPTASGHKHSRVTILDFGLADRTQMAGGQHWLDTQRYVARMA